MNKIGIFRGTFDPIHKGHIEFANLAQTKYKLKKVYFLPESNPLHKSQISSLTSRKSVITKAIINYPGLELLDSPNLNGTISKLLPELLRMFTNSKLVFLMGSDVAKTLPSWKDLPDLVTNNELIIGLRKNDTKKDIELIIEKLNTKPEKYEIINTPNPAITSSMLRLNNSSEV